MTKRLTRYENDEFYKLFRGVNYAVKTHPDGFLLPGNAVNVVQHLQNYRARPDDVYVIAYPKAGTTWMQEMVYLVATNLDFNGAKDIADNRIPFLENFMSMCGAPDTDFWDPPSVTDKFSRLNMWPKNHHNDASRIELEYIERKASPRYIRTHLPYQLLPSSIIDNKCKIIYVCRNPKDTLVSYHHSNVMMSTYKYVGDFSTFVDFFLSDNVIYSPYFKHILPFWERRHDDNIMFVSYEEIIMDPMVVVKNIADFLEKELTDEEIIQITEHCSFDQMSENPATNRKAWEDYDGLIDSSKGTLLRKGMVGDWKNYITAEMNDRIDAWVEKNLRGTNLEFSYELEYTYHHSDESD